MKLAERIIKAHQNQIIFNKKKIIVKLKRPEDILQVQCFEWLDLKYKDTPFRDLIYHVPNELYIKDKQQMEYELKKRCMLGVRRGIWDTTIDINIEGCRGFKIEFKSKTGILTSEQKVYMKYYQRMCFGCIVIRDLNEWIYTINDIADTLKKDYNNLWMFEKVKKPVK